MASVLSRRAARALQTRLYSTAARQEADARQAVLIPQAPQVTKLPNGITVASIENYSPVARVAVVAKAGSRFEDGDNLGVSHCLRVASGLSTSGSTAFKITRSIEQAGGELSCSATREYMFYQVNSARGNLDLVGQTLKQLTTEPTFKPWELSDIQGRLGLEVETMKSQPNMRVFDLLHKAAFRNTLGNSLYAPEFMIGKYSTEQLLHYMKTYFSTNRLALVGVGVDHDELCAQAKNINPFASAEVATDKAKYSGGEIRVETGGNLTYAAMAVEGPSLTGNELLHAAVLQNIMGMGPTIKYTSGSATSKLTGSVLKATNQPFAINCINANYTDNGLFGFFAVAQPREIEKVLRAAFGTFASVAKSGVDEADVARAKQQLKAQISMHREGGDSLLYDLGEQALGSQEILTTADLVKFVESINTADVTNVAKRLIGGRPSMAAVGNLSRTPYADDLVQ